MAEEERYGHAIGIYCMNACRCGICGKPAYRLYNTFHCTANPAHMADTFTGIFSDCSYPYSKYQILRQKLNIVLTFLASQCKDFPLMISVLAKFYSHY